MAPTITRKEKNLLSEITSEVDNRNNTSGWKVVQDKWKKKYHRRSEINTFNLFEENDSLVLV